MAESILSRIFGRTPVPEAKAGEISGVTMDPGIHFFSPDGTRTIYRMINGTSSEAERVTAQTAYAAAAYAYVALRWRAARLAEAPLMVVDESTDTGDDEWLPNHPLAQLLSEPSPDYSMDELLFRTSLSIDQDGQAVWLKERNGRGLPGRLQFFRGTEVTVEATNQSVRGRYQLATTRGQKMFAPDDVVYFHEPNPADWTRGLSRLEVFLGWLNLGQVARATVRDLLANSVWPSIIVQPDPAWNPTDEQFGQYKAGLDAYAQPGKRGRAMSVLGGGNATVVSSRVKDLVPGELLNRVESVAASVFGVPAIVLQYEVGLQNSPWSQMEQARRMAYEDTAEPQWKSVAETLTRQLLRPIDPDRSHFVRFDSSRVRALTRDKVVMTGVATQWTEIATLNERRTLVGLEPSDDPEADLYPWEREAAKAAAAAARVDAAVAAMRQGDAEDNDAPPPEAEPDDDPDTAAAAAVAAAAKAQLPVEVKRDIWAAIRAQQISEAEFEWAVMTAALLADDAEEIAHLADEHLGAAKASGPTPERRKRFFRSVRAYLTGTSAEAWESAAKTLVEKHARRSAATVVSDLGFGFDLVRPGLALFAEAEVGFLVRSISSTTRDAVESAVTSGLESGASIADITRNLRDLPAFNRDRAQLVARTESARVMNGAPTEMMQTLEADTGRRFTKTWSGALDDRERDEHVAMEGETVGINDVFSNGIQYPSEPNCRCVLTYKEVVA